MKEKKNTETEASLDRRSFLGAAALAGAAMAACSGGAESKVSLGPTQKRGPDQAPDGAPLRAGLVGCGGRGTGAALNFLEAGPNLQVVALADVFADRIENCRAKLKEQGVEVADDRVYVGFDAYKELIASDLDIVMLATPPHFRPEHFAAAVDARKDIFMEKPLAVDPVGARALMQTAEKADAFGLRVVTGTQRHHQPEYIETYNRIMDGAIGEIVAARCYWNQGQLWFKEKQTGWSDMEHMIRDWVNWQWLSGDHIVEQHIHNIDVVNWFTNSHPVKAVGSGGRARRVTGDQYDYFNVDYEMENGLHVMSMCRQVDGCANNVSEYLVGTKGSSNCKDKIYSPDGEVVWAYDKPEGERSPYVLEHVNLVTAIRSGESINEAHKTAISTLVAIMGRISAYTGEEVTWEQMMSSDMRLGPTEYAMGSVDLQASVPVPGAGKDTASEAG